MGLAATASIVFSLMAPITIHLFTDAIPKLAKQAVARAARRLPVAMRRDQEAAWLADFAVLETDVERLRCALGCWSTSIRARWPFVLEQTQRDLVTARQALKIHGAIAWYAIGRIKAWNTSDDPNNWGYAEKLCFSTLVVAGGQLPKLMKDFFIKVEVDMKARSTGYTDKQHFAKEIIYPIYREVKIMQFLGEHNLIEMPGKESNR